ncbi:MAG: hypothetical protein JKY89_02095 [Immundisolibacteraceae bacterium]|nr:hypothetical protein [Immundisolibacteraceae bacterium]
MAHKLFSVMLLIGFLGIGSAVKADDLQASLSAVGCVACHKMDSPLVGPSYKQVADKYRGDSGAAEMLLAKVKNGGSGTWGPIPIPPHADLNEAQIQPLIDGIVASH